MSLFRQQGSSGRKLAALVTDDSVHDSVDHDQKWNPCTLVVLPVLVARPMATRSGDAPDRGGGEDMAMKPCATQRLYKLTNVRTSY